MSKLTQSQLAVCSWSLHPGTPQELAQRVKETGLSAVQLALNPVSSDARVWGDAGKVLAGAGIRIISGMFGTVGEDYSTLETIRKTGGVVPDEHWHANWRIVQNAANVAADLGLKCVSTHAGFLPHEPSDPAFAKLADRIACIAELFESKGLTLLFETGQETAETLLAFLEALDDMEAVNTGVNFDPANMILYDKGDPVASLQTLLPRVKQVHVKDAVRTRTAGTWGTEVAVGQGQVDWKSFVATLAGGDFTGSLVIEREAGEQRVQDVRQAVEVLKPLIGGAASQGRST